MTLSADDKQLLRQYAQAAIVAGLEQTAFMFDSTQCSEMLLKKSASFVTLHLGDQLRGCIGSLEPVRPLVEDVIQNARAAAFEDPRFMPLTAEELPKLTIHIAVLGSATPLMVANEAALVSQLRIGIDGLVLQEGSRRATFLPAVWTSLPAPEQFVRELKRKAGFASDDYWSEKIQCFTYTVEEF